MNSPNKRNEECDDSAVNGLCPNVQSQSVSVDFNPCLIWNLFIWRYFSQFRAAVDGILRSGEDLNLIKTCGGRLRVTLWGLTADPWTACGADASISAICVIRANTIKRLTGVHLSIWCKRRKHDTFSLITPFAWQNLWILLDLIWQHYITERKKFHS